MAAVGGKEPVAIVGMACRFPGGVRGPDEFWKMLVSGRDAVTDVPADRWSIDAHCHPNIAFPARSVSRRGGFIDGPDLFDYKYFGISPREAERTDPQQRLMLEIAVEALHDAGHPAGPGRDDRIGVYVGVSYCDYAAIRGRDLANVDGHSGSGSALSMVATRVSHRLGLSGPSMAVDTACSSSLVAIDQACRAIATGECTAAIAGGVNLMLSPETTLYLGKAAMLSPDGVCRTFDAAANGYVRGEGAGAIVLKPLSAARRDGDRIHAVILASSTNQDGHTISMTEPSAAAQARLMRQACAQAGIDPARLSYVEAHGTGTPVGDPIEAAAISEAFGKGRDRPLLIGSVKTNIGHLESASGVAGLIKVVLSLKNRAVPPSLHFRTPNPKIDFDRSGLAVTRKLTRLAGGERLIMGVNSFGFGGTNAHVLLQEAPAGLARRPGHVAARAREKTLVTLSAPDEAGLRQQAQALAISPLRRASGPGHRDIAAALALRREHLPYRASFQAGSRAQMFRTFDALAAGDLRAAEELGMARPDPGIVFVFCGQGTQWAGMGRGLLRSEPAFAREVERIDALFRDLAGWSVLDRLKGPMTARDLRHTELSQPLIFAVQVASAALWKAWGIRPAATVGHSLGEIAAAHVAGALSLSDAVKVVYHRSRLQQRTEGEGGMLVCRIPREDFDAHWAGRLNGIEIAAVNGPGSVTLAGPAAALGPAARMLTGAGVETVRLNVEYAFHSAQMEGLRDELIAALDGLRPRRTAIPMISTVTGQEIAGGRFDARYWWENVRHEVRFRDAVLDLIDRGYRTFLDLGPAQVLNEQILECADSRKCIAQAHRTMERGERDSYAFRRTLQRFHVNGHDIDWRQEFPGKVAHVPLPPHAWKHERCWIDNADARHFRFVADDHVLLGKPQRTPEPSWIADISQRGLPYLADHLFGSIAVFPATAFFEMARAAARQVGGDGPVRLSEIRLDEVLNLPPDTPVRVMTRYDPARRRIEILSQPTAEEGDWVRHLSAKVQVLGGAEDSPAASLPRPRQAVSPARFYDALDRDRAGFGPSFRGLMEILVGADEVVATARMTDTVQAESGDYLFHPAYLDCCLHAARGFLPFADSGSSDFAQIPNQCSRAAFYGPPGDEIRVHLRKAEANANCLVVDIDVFTPEGRLLAEFRRLSYQRFAIPQPVMAEAGFYVGEWVEAPPPIADDSTADQREILVLADDGGQADALVERLRQRGLRAHVAHVDKDFGGCAETGWRIDPGSAVHCRQIVDALTGADRRIGHVVFMWPLDLGPPDGFSGEDVIVAARRTTLPVMLFLQAILDREAYEFAFPKFWLITQHAQPVGAERSGGVPGLMQSPVWGLGRSFFNEMPDFAGGIVDLGRHWSPEVLANHILSRDPPAELALRGEVCHTNHLAEIGREALAPKIAPRAVGDRPAAYALRMPKPGNLDRLSLQVKTRDALKGREIRVKVHAGGLNFRDVMAALGVLPDEAEPTAAWECLGLEVAGVVEECGDAVRFFAPGSRVIVMGRGLFASEVVVDERQAFALDDAISMEDAATIPVAFLTADIALNQMGAMAAGSRVLIHSATGGVGLAALALARIAGAEIYATAGSEEKRDRLRALGVERVYNSRDASFAQGILRDTAGEGVDIVLNSLSGALRDVSLELLRPFGRFLEIGKTDIYLDRPISASDLRRNVQFIAIDVAQIAVQRPDIIARSLANVLDHLKSGRASPLPVTRFGAGAAAEAFRYMGKGRHIGKVVLGFDEEVARICGSPDQPPVVHKDGAYLVTGGIADFGARLGAWLHRQGAGVVYLAGRKGEPRPEVSDVLGPVLAAGGDIRLIEMDVNSAESVAEVLDRIDRSGPPLRGIAHLAAYFGDSLLYEMTEDKMFSVMWPKTVGAWNLHRATRERDLDFFLMFSSLAAEVGAPFQSNYAAANIFLNALAHHRRGLGLPALTISWGAIGGFGFVARNNAVKEHLERMGVDQIPFDAMLGALGTAFDRDMAEVIVARFNFEKLALATRRMPIRDRLRQLVEPRVMSAKDLSEAFRQELRLLGPERARAVVREFYRKEIASLLKLKLEEVDPDRPLDEIGMDSLSSVELKLRLEAFGLTQVPVSVLRRRPSIEDLVDLTLAGAVSSQTDSG